MQKNIMKARIGEKAPLLSVSDWVQGEPCTLDQLSGKVVLVDVFQVNCPGCFLYSLPQAIDLYHRYSNSDLTVIGVATAFEDFDKNNLANLIKLVKNSEVIGETQRLLSLQGNLAGGRWPHRIPFPVAMDRLNKREKDMSDNEITAFIKDRIPNFEQQAHSYQQQIRRQAQNYFQSLTYRAETFERYDLQGTPSHILVDRQGVLRERAFGAYPELEARILELLNE